MPRLPAAKLDIKLILEASARRLPAYRALWQFLTARFEWEKTEHGLGPRGSADSE
jgi:hypothetical protein